MELEVYAVRQKTATPEETVPGPSHDVAQEGPVDQPPQPIVPEKRKVRQLPSVSQHYHVRIGAVGSATVRAPRSGFKLRLTYVHMTAAGAAYVYLRFAGHTDTGAQICPNAMAANATVNANLVGTNIEGGSDEALEVVSDTAVNIDVMVVVEEVPHEVRADEDDP